MDELSDRWNHNIHYHPLILEAIPTEARRALDIGCGEGTLARQLQQRIPDVTGIDLDEASIGPAAANNRNRAGLRFVRGDLFDYPFESASFDFVTSVATLHHMDEVAALCQIRDLLRPGGVLCIVGLARSRLPLDIPIEIAAAVAHRYYAQTKDVWQHPSPVMPTPPETYADMRRIITETLPGARFRRHLLWRYSATWIKPAD